MGLIPRREEVLNAGLLKARLAFQGPSGPWGKVRRLSPHSPAIDWKIGDFGKFSLEKAQKIKMGRGLFAEEEKGRKG